MALTCSVVIPLYNKAPHICRAVDSVLSQDFPVFEVLIVDDGSTDGSDKLIQSYTDLGVKMYRRTAPSPGGYAARNLGIEKAKGQWIAFLDADDEWLPGHLRRLFALHDAFPDAQLLGCGWCLSDGSKTTLSRLSKKIQAPRIFNPLEYLAIQGSGTDMLHTDVVAVSKDLLGAIGGFPEASTTCRRAGDGQTWLRCVLHGAKVAWRPEPGAIYYQNAVNMVTRSGTYQLSENCLITFLDNLLRDQDFTPREFKPALRRYRNSRVLSHLFQYARSGRVRWAQVSMAVKHFQLDPRIVLLLVAWVCPRAGKAVFKLKDRLSGVWAQ